MVDKKWEELNVRNDQMFQEWSIEHNRKWEEELVKFNKQIEATTHDMHVVVEERIKETK